MSAAGSVLDVPLDAIAQMTHSGRESHKILQHRQNRQRDHQSAARQRFLEHQGTMRAGDIVRSLDGDNAEWLDQGFETLLHFPAEDSFCPLPGSAYRVCLGLGFRV